MNPLNYHSSCHNTHIGAYVITCNKTRHRLPILIDNLQGSSLEPVLVTNFDEDYLPIHIYKPSLWNKHYSKISSILVANLVAMRGTEAEIPQVIRDGPPRTLKSSELSLSAKILWSFYHSIANSFKYTLIMEDDISIDRNSDIPSKKLGINLDKIITASVNMNSDFCDIGSLPFFSQDWIARHPFSGSTLSNNLYSTKVMLTRSTCCFLISNRLLEFIFSNTRIEYALPIDFHLQYLLSLADGLKPSFFKGMWCNTGLFVNSSLNAPKDKRMSSL